MAFVKRPSKLQQNLNFIESFNRSWSKWGISEIGLLYKFLTKANIPQGKGGSKEKGEGSRQANLLCESFYLLRNSEHKKCK